MLRTVLVAAMLFAGVPRPLITLTATEVGINGENLKDTPVSDPINMQGRWNTNQLTLMMAVTPGSSTQMIVTCDVSLLELAGYKPIQRCTSGDPHVCVPKRWKYNLANEVGPLNVPSNYPWIKCTFDDPDNGTGTIVVTAIRGVQ